MEHDDLTLDILLHWMKSDTMTRNSILKYILDISDPDKLRLIDGYVRNIV